MPDLVARLSSAMGMLEERFKIRADGPQAKLDLLEITIIGRLGAVGAPPVQGELEQALGLPKPTMANALRRLERRGLLSRESSIQHRPAKVLILTNDGVALANSLRTAQLAASRSMLAALTEKEQRQLVLALEKIARANERPG